MSPMRSLSPIWMLVAAAAAGCGDGGDGDGNDNETARYRVAWSIAPDGQPSTCADELITEVRVSVAPRPFGPSQSVTMAACSDGFLVTDPLPLGEHLIWVIALGPYGEWANVTSVQETLAVAGEVTEVPAVALDVDPPEMSFQTEWELRRGGMRVTCADAGVTAVSIRTTPQGMNDLIDIYPCDGFAQRIEVPLGPLTTQATLLGAGDVELLISQEDVVEAERGVAVHAFELTVP